MPTVTDVSSTFDVSKQTARIWTAEFAEHLSPGANPPPGKAREFNADDMAVFALIAEMRQSNAPYDDIRASLAAGQRGRPSDFAPSGSEQPTAGAALAPIALFEQFAQRLDQQYRGQLEKTENDLQQERAARIEAEKRAVRAETELRLLTERVEGEKASQASQARQQGETRGWIDRLLGR